MTDLQRMLSRALSDATLGRGEVAALRARLQREPLTQTELLELTRHAFSLVEQRLKRPDDRQALGALQRVVELIFPSAPEATDGGGEAYFSPGDECRERIERALGAARSRADICVFTITDDRLSRRIEAAHRRGVRVRIITDDDKSEDRGSDIERLERSGVPVRVDRTNNHMHHKFALFDRQTLLTGSYNWTRSASRYNQENVVVLSEPGLLRRFERTFEVLWRQFE